MINSQLLNPKNIVVVGGSNDLQKPGGKILFHILNGFKGDVFVTNRKNDLVQGIKAYSSVEDLPVGIDLAVLAIVAKDCPQVIKTLALEKGTKAFIVISAGFSEEGEAGALLEKEMVETANRVGACLIGPNCIGVMNVHHTSVFTTPLPPLHADGADFISGSGATAVFIMEAGMPLGLRFNSVFSVGNSAQVGVEEVLAYLDDSFNPLTSSKIKLLYIESIKDPLSLLKHARSLIQKGCRIAAIKSGSSAEGSRAASSHTGAMANSDIAVDALFKKAGIVRCYGRMELAYVAAIFMHKELLGRNIAIVTHAGGPAVMLTDTLSKGSFQIPKLTGEKSDVLKQKLYAGSSVTNPIDFLATGNAQQLSHILDACENDFDQIDAVVVIFGSPGLFQVKDVYNVLHGKIRRCRKPIFCVLPSVVNAKEDIDCFISQGNVAFSDEVLFGEALIKACGVKMYPFRAPIAHENSAIKSIIQSQENGYLSPEKVNQLLVEAGIPVVQEYVIDKRSALKQVSDELGFPLVMKVVGPNHKSDVGGVVLHVRSLEQMRTEFDRLMRISGANGVLMQPMLLGTELFIGAKYEEGFGHLVLCGLGGVFVEVLKDVSSALAPLSIDEALQMIKELRGYKILEGVRGSEGVNINRFAQIIVAFSHLLMEAPEIKEVDLNPLIGDRNTIVTVDARIKIEKE
jgi:acetyltransferase